MRIVFSSFLSLSSLTKQLPSTISDRYFAVHPACLLRNKTMVLNMRRKTHERTICKSKKTSKLTVIFLYKILWYYYLVLVRNNFGICASPDESNFSSVIEVHLTYTTYTNKIEKLMFYLVKSAYFSGTTITTLD